MIELALDFRLTPLAQIVVEAILRTARMIAVVAGGIVLVDSFAPEARAPADRRTNAKAWAWVAFGSLFGGALTLYATYGMIEAKVDVSVARTILWVGLANGLVMRSASTADRPRWIWLTAALIGVFGLAISFVDIWLV